MANDIKTKVWDLDTVGVVSDNPVQIDGISITWLYTAGTVKQVTLSSIDPNDNKAGSEIFYATESSAVPITGNQTIFYPLKGIFQGLHVTTLTSAGKVLVYTK
jgi:hypothetical protein